MTAVEFAMLLPVILWLSFGGLQLALLHTAQSLLDNAGEIASRMVATGQAQTSGFDAGRFKSSLCASVWPLFTCSRLQVDVRSVAAISASDAAVPALTFDGNGQITNTWSYTPGGQDQTVIVRLMYAWPTVSLLGMDFSNLPDGSHFIVATNVVRTERFQ